METYAPVSYRIQVRNSIDFNYVREIAPYLRQLGITHLYLSPIFKAPEQSSHGYDIADPTEVCPSLGGIDAFIKFADYTKKFGLKIILDIVPNHMSADPKANLWWWDVLEKGSWSFYEDYFDIYWAEFSQIPYRDKIVLPILGESLDQVIESKNITMEIENGMFQLSYFDHKVPINLQGVVLLLEALPSDDNMKPIIQSLHKLKPRSLNRFFVSKESFHDYHQKITGEINAIVNQSANTNKSWQELWNHPASYDELIGRVLDQQYYKLVWWRNGRYLINYRRFFTINDLIAIKEEKYEVFTKTHQLIFDFCRQGLVDGLRIDHPDGLSQPTRYFKYLRQEFPEILLFAEKILESSEDLPNWPIDGTTGYDFLADLNAFFLAPDFEKQFSDFYEEFIHCRDDYQDMVKQQKKKLLQGDLNADFQRVVRLFYDLVYTNRSTTDQSVKDCEIFLEDLIVSLNVYRTYLVIEQDSPTHQQGIKHWQASLKRMTINQNQFQPLSNYFQSIIHDLLRSPAEQTFLEYLQKLTSPVMAKAVEDQAFYNYNRMVLLNEVGSDPRRYGMSLKEFHQRQIRRSKEWPKSMLASSTHDTKRSEDVRSRMLVLAEMPQQWGAIIATWQQKKSHLDPESTIDPRTTYFMYQNLVGCWPISLNRFQEFMIKSAREADHQTSWRSPDTKFEKNLSDLITKLFEDEEFVRSVEKFVQILVPFGTLNSLNLALIKLTSPGIPDIYQGCETYQFSLVDPDNRRKVNYQDLQESLNHCEKEYDKKEVFDWTKATSKLWLVQLILKVRQQYKADFMPGSSYQELLPESEDNPAIFAYIRGQNICVIGSRFPFRYQQPANTTVLKIPTEGNWYDLINQQKIPRSTIQLSEVWRHFPASLIVNLRS